MANIHPEALVAALAAAAKTPPPGMDPNAGSGGGSAQTAAPSGSPSPAGPGGGSVDPTQLAGAAPGDPNADPNAQGGQDPQEQAVWNEFPSTDPGQIEALAQQMQGQGDPQQLLDALTQLLQQSQADRDKLDQMQEQMLGHLMDLLQGAGAGLPPGAGSPQDASQGAPVPAGPGVGGAGTGY